MAGRRWTEEEMQLLEDLIGTYTVASIAKRLGRSFDSVNLKLIRMGLQGFEKSTDLLIKHQVCVMLGIHHRTFERWKENGLHVMRKGNYNVVHQEELIQFLESHPELWNAAKVTDDSLLMRFPWYKEKKRTDVKKAYHWTPEEVQKLKYLRHQGYSIPEIAEKMGRSQSSIKFKAYGRNRNGIHIGYKG